MDNLDQDNNGIYTISLPSNSEGVPELTGISEIETILSNNFSIINSKQFSTSPNKYQVNVDLASNGKSLEFEIINILTRSEVTDLSSEKLELVIMGSSDGANFCNTKNGASYELEDEFKSSSHIKTILNDVSDSQNPQQISERETIDKSIFNNYTLTFADNLVDGLYTVSIEDDAGNKVTGTSANEPPN